MPDKAVESGGSVRSRTMPPVSLAPLRGVTLAPMRNALFSEFGGYSWALAPFVPLGSGSARPPLRVFSDVAPESCGTVPTLPQVIGRDPAALSAAASVLRDLGYSRLNLNCGCPWKFVARKGRGSGLLDDPVALGAMLEAGCEAMPGGFSVKVRLGWQDASSLEKIIPLLNSFPLEMVIIHPRTGIQMYGGTADEEAFGSLAPQLRAPVVYNGDVFSAKDALRLASRFPFISGIMIGRGACARPWLGESIAKGADPEPEELRALRARTKTFAAGLASEYSRTLFGPAPLMGRMKELWGYLHAAFEDGEEGLRRIQRARTPEAMFAAIESLCSE